MAGYLKLSAFKRITQLLADFALVGHNANGENFQIAFKDFYSQLNLASTTGGGTPIFFDGNVLPSTDNTGQPVTNGAWTLLTPGVTYTNIGGGENIITPLGRWSIAQFSEGSWRIRDLGELPQTFISSELGGSDTIGASQALVTSIKRSLDSIATETSQLFDNSTMLPYAWQSSGQPNTSLNWIRTPRIKLKNGETQISVSGAGFVPTTSARFIFFNSSGDVVSTVASSSNSATSQTSAIPAGAVEAAVNVANLANAGSDPTNSPFASTFMFNYGAVKPYEEYGSKIKISGIEGGDKLLTTDQLNPTTVNSQIESLQNAVFVSSNTTFGVASPDAGNNNTSSGRTRIDNLYVITSSDGSPIGIEELNIFINVAGSGRIKFVQKILDSNGAWIEGTYNVSADFVATFTQGLNTFNSALFGANFTVPNNTYVAIYIATPAAASVALGQTGVSYQYTSSGGNLQTGSVATITSGILQFNVKTRSSANKILEVENRVKEIEDQGANLPELFYKYDHNTSNGTGSLRVYTKFKGNKFGCHLITRTINNTDAVFSDYWRYTGCYLSTYTNGSFVDSLELVTSQESEFVYQQVGKIDFAGGYHGDEKINNDPGKGARFYVDGRLLDLSASFPLAQGSKFKYVVHSIIYEAPGRDASNNPVPNPAHPPQADHIKITELYGLNFKTTNHCTWRVAIQLSQYYSGIFCTGVNLVTHAYNNLDFIERDLTVAGNKEATSGQGITECTSRNPVTKLGLHIFSKIINGGSVLADAMKWFSKRDNGFPNQYIKDYFGLRTSYISGAPAEIINTVVGETFSSETIVTFNIAS